ncbi:MAG TPA: hypothetical protein VGN07_22445 [Steroidobacteraceae bacterium]
MAAPRLFSYKLTTDSGFAPNPFWGALTLATCKPGMRRSKRVGDWIAGFTSRDLTGSAVGEEKLIFVMQVKNVLPFVAYYRAREFKAKIPVRGGDLRNAVGDNIYKPLVADPRSSDDFEQNRYGCHTPDHQHHDLSGKNVLTAVRFAYFGRGAIAIPDRVRPQIPAGQHPQGYQTHDFRRVARFIAYIEDISGLEAALVDLPTDWPKDEPVPQGCGGVSQRFADPCSPKKPRRKARRC